MTRPIRLISNWASARERRVYVDHGLTGKNRDRPGLREAMAACHDGDTLVVTKLDRLARSLPDAGDIVAELTHAGVRLSIGGTIHDPADPVGRLLFNVLAMVAEFESDLIRARTREGMAVARAKGRLRGKPPKLKPAQEAHLVELWRAGHHTSTELAELFSVARSTVYRAVHRAGQPPHDPVPPSGGDALEPRPGTPAAGAGAAPTPEPRPAEKRSPNAETTKTATPRATGPSHLGPAEATRPAATTTTTAGTTWAPAGRQPAGPSPAPRRVAGTRRGDAEEEVPSRRPVGVRVSAWGELPAEKPDAGVLRVLIAGQHAGQVRRDGPDWIAEWSEAPRGHRPPRPRVSTHDGVEAAVTAVVRSGYARRLGATGTTPVSWTDRARRRAARARAVTMRHHRAPPHPTACAPGA